VEVRGFEPLTPAVRRQCSTGLSYTPRNRARVAEGLAPTVQASDGGGGVGAGGGGGADGAWPVAGAGSPAAPGLRRGPTIRSANTSPIALSSGRRNAWKFMRRFCLVGLEILPQFHSLLSVCRSLIVIESRGSDHASLRARGPEGGVHEDQAPVGERHVVVAHAEDQEPGESEQTLGQQRVRPETP
jgi:hypothetical protein